MQKNRANQLVFKQTVYRYYRNNRRDFPWRNTTDPYRILVAEIMLQQTQAPRVVEKYLTFIKRFPTVAVLARAPQSSALKYWSGLGYNRRGLLLQKAAKIIMTDYRGRVPRNIEALGTLPGVGPYTAAAIAVFAYNQPHSLIETNVRATYIHHFFPDQTGVSDRELLPLIAATIDTKNPRRWYSALMDYGTMLKKTLPNPSRRSQHYAKQSTFKGSSRHVRGSILRLLITHRKITKKQISTVLPEFSLQQTQRALDALTQEGLIKKQGQTYRL